MLNHMWGERQGDWCFEQTRVMSGLSVKQVAVGKGEYKNGMMNLMRAFSASGKSKTFTQ